MGDSTFSHTGMIAISDSIKNGQDITYIILDNKTTAMTGHQPTPGVDVDVLGKPTFAQDIEKTVAGLAGDSSAFIARMDPSQRQNYDALVRKTLLRDGVKIIIADKEWRHHLPPPRAGAPERDRQRTGLPAGRKAHQHQRRRLRVLPRMHPSYRMQRPDGRGLIPNTVPRSPSTRPPALPTVPAPGSKSAMATKPVPRLRRSRSSAKPHPPSRPLPIDVGQLPTPAHRPLSDIWYTYIAGVGGMGVNVVASVLAQAGVRQGYEVRLTNKKGLAIRNGSVYSHLSYAPKGTPVSPLIPCGKADLLFGLDVLEAARGPRTPRPLPHRPPGAHRRHRQYRQDPHDRHPHRPRGLLGRSPSRPDPPTHPSKTCTSARISSASASTTWATSSTPTS